MKFVEIINRNKFTLISILLFLYVILNLLDGKRGLISYYEKLKLKNELIEEANQLENIVLSDIQRLRLYDLLLDSENIFV